MVQCAVCPSAGTEHAWSLAMSDPIMPFLHWANQAVQRYQLRAPTVRFLGQSENITFQVSQAPAGERFLLRLHRPLTTTFVGVRQQPDAIQSELHLVGRTRARYVHSHSTADPQYGWRACHPDRACTE